MKWDVESIRNFMKELDKKSGYNGANYPIEIDGRMKSVMGQIRYINNRITGEILEITRFKFSKELLEYYSDDVIKETIVHEYCHFLTIVKYGTAEHDRVFKEENKKFGYSGETYFNATPIKKIPEKIQKIYHIGCTNCGFTTTRKRKMNLNNYRCPYCKGELEYK